MRHHNKIGPSENLPHTLTLTLALTLALTFTLTRTLAPCVGTGNEQVAAGRDEEVYRKVSAPRMSASTTVAATTLSPPLLPLQQ